jgi:Bacterial protein of unknown function (Gcw_chp)
LQSTALTLQSSDYRTVEARASLGWKIATLSVSRSLTDYLGLAARQTGPLGTKVIESKGTTYVALDLEWPLRDSITLTTGAGRLSVPNFDGLGYTDWRIGAAATAWGLRWSLQASGQESAASSWRLASRSGSTSTTLTGAVAWTF